MITSSLTNSQRQQASRYGLSEKTAEKIVQDPALMSVLQTLPPTLTGRLKELSAAEKGVMYKDISGTTRFAFVKIENRQAFIDGNWKGINVSPFMDDRIDQDARHGDITRAEAGELKDSLHECQKLTPKQREAMVTIILLECNPSGDQKAGRLI